ncbi:hypothetical protein MMC13_007392 [Lambiella insularis]|nr:hypothetical protein [Lambiella insularis]
MAYNSAFNPDALPAHAEPEQAAQILAQNQQNHQTHLPAALRPHSNSTSSTPSPYQPPSYQNKPPPPIPPQNLQQTHPQYRRQSPSSSSLGPSYTPTDRPFPAPSPNHHQVSQPYTPPLRSPPPPRPATTQPTAGDPSLFPLFRAVDKRGTGQLTEAELRTALVNGDFTSFDAHTVRMMIRMFDADRSGTIGFEEFCNLWGFLAAWRALFERFDADRSGRISQDEFATALLAFGYHVSAPFVGLLYRAHARPGAAGLSFDLFVQSCIGLKRMTDVFKRYDTDRDGYITLSFEEFLTGECEEFCGGEREC